MSLEGALRRLAPWLVLIMGLSLTVAATRRAFAISQTRNELRFRSTADQLAQAVSARVDTYIALLRSTRGLVHEPELRTAERFRDFIHRLRLETQYPGILGIGFAQHIHPEQQEEVERFWMEHGREGFEIWPEPTSGPAFPIVLLEPANQMNLRAYGYDMFSEPVRREAMVRAWHTGRPAATGRVRLVQEETEEGQAGFLIYLPVYRELPPYDEEPGGMTEIEGFVYSPFRADDLFRGIFSTAVDHGIHVEVYDNQVTTPEHLLHSSGERPSHATPLTRHVEIGGRTWTVTFTPSERVLESSQSAWWTLLLGTLVTTLIVLLMRNQERARVNSEEHAAQLLRSEQAARNSESLKQAILDAALDGIVTADGRGVVVEFNPAAERVFGYLRADVIGRSFIDVVFPPRLREGYRRGMQEHLATGARKLIGQRMELTAMRADGTEFPVEMAISRIELQGQQMFTSYVRDITERRQADAHIRELNESLERRVQQRTAELQDANRQLESFSYSVSHDLRAPARHVLGFAELLNKRVAESSDPTAQRLARVITDSARRMAQLIDDLLTFSRTSRQELRRGPVDMNNLVAEAVRVLTPEFTGRQIEWSVSPLPNVEGDSSLLAQVWVNLLSNAVKYTRRRDVAQITVGGRRDADESVFWVSDNGTGFDMQYVGKLFGVFQRLHREEEFEGTGIGLANVARIVQRHGGRVWAEAEPNVGATFSFSIPHRPADFIGPLPTRNDRATERSPMSQS